MMSETCLARSGTTSIVSVLMLFLGCASGEIKPVDIYPEDQCSLCRMAFSDHRFASEIIDDQGEIFKFDDIGCMMTFKEERKDVRTAAMFVKDYDTRQWIPYARAAIVETDIDTPMGSGRVAFADSAKAAEFQSRHPLTQTEPEER